MISEYYFWLVVFFPTGFSSCATYLSTWPVRFRLCCEHLTGDHASSITTGEFIISDMSCLCSTDLFLTVKEEDIKI